MRQTKVEWPFVKLLVRKRGNRVQSVRRLAANAERIYSLLSLVLFRTYLFVCLSPLSSLPLAASRSRFSPDLLIGNHCHAANCQLVVRQIGSGANALSLPVVRKAYSHQLNGVFDIHGICIFVSLGRAFRFSSSLFASHPLTSCLIL